MEKSLIETLISLRNTLLDGAYDKSSHKDAIMKAVARELSALVQEINLQEQYALENDLE